MSPFRPVVGIFFFLILSLLSVFGGTVATGTVRAETDRPNVLFIAVDDMRTDLGCYGNTAVKTPNLDRLAARGMVFRRAYCQQAVCSPSRTSLLTGLRPDSTKVYDLETHFRDTVGNDLITLPQCFKNNGYQVVGISKIYHGGLDDPVSWSRPWLPPRGAGYVLPENTAYMNERRAQGLAQGLTGKKLSYYVRGPATECADVPDDAYTDGQTTQRAIELMRGLAEQEKPFFLAVGFLKPHLPFCAPKRYWDMYSPESIELAANDFPPQGAPPFALTDFGELRNYSDMPKQGPVSPEQARRLIHGYRACLSFTDANIGRLLDELDRLGLADNTIVVVWGDHGWKLGEHACWCKHTNFENDAHAPLIVAAPGRKAIGGSTEALVEFVDIYPSLCGLAGLEKPEHLQGSDFSPLLDDPALPWKSAAFSQYPRSYNKKGLMGYSMRTDRYRFTLWQNRKNPDDVVAVELYDHQNDPAENVNVAEKPENRELVEQLREKLQAGWPAVQAEVAAGTNK